MMSWMKWLSSRNFSSPFVPPGHRRRGILNKRASLPAVLLIHLLSIGPGVAHELKTERLTGTGGDFTLTSAAGPLSLKDLRGKVVLIFFGYTSCPDVCPLSLWIISRMFTRMSFDELSRVQALFITLDPGRDTPEVLQQYTGYFHPRIIGLSDRMDVLAKVASQYGVKYERKALPGSPLGYSIAHTLKISVVDRAGRLQNSVPHNIAADLLLVRVRSLLEN